MGLVSTLISTFAPVLYLSLSSNPNALQKEASHQTEANKFRSSLILSPLTSYTDQILSIQRNGTSAGFSLDIPLIMLCASILKIFYWPGARYDVALLVQALIMVAVQVVLLKVRLVELVAGVVRSSASEADSGSWRRWRSTIDQHGEEKTRSEVWKGMGGRGISGEYVSCHEIPNLTVLVKLSPRNSGRASGCKCLITAPLDSRKNPRVFPLTGFIWKPLTVSRNANAS